MATKNKKIKETPTEEYLRRIMNALERLASRPIMPPYSQPSQPLYQQGTSKCTVCGRDVFPNLYHQCSPFLGGFPMNSSNRPDSLSKVASDIRSNLDGAYKDKFMGNADF